jgi:hypothetical protein
VNNLSFAINVSQLQCQTIPQLDKSFVSILAVRLCYSCFQLLMEMRVAVEAISKKEMESVLPLGRSATQTVEEFLRLWNVTQACCVRGSISSPHRFSEWPEIRNGKMNDNCFELWIIWVRKTMKRMKRTFILEFSRLCQLISFQDQIAETIIGSEDYQSVVCFRIDSLTPMIVNGESRVTCSWRYGSREKGTAA